MLNVLYFFPFWNILSISKVPAGCFPFLSFRQLQLFPLVKFYFLDHSERRSVLINNYLRTKALFDSRYGTFGRANEDSCSPEKFLSSFHNNLANLIQKTWFAFLWTNFFFEFLPLHYFITRFCSLLASYFYRLLRAVNMNKWRQNSATERQEQIQRWGASYERENEFWN